ncbi:MAG: hypothetical protein AAF741_07790 [Bacteroidota bacterium]
MKWTMTVIILIYWIGIDAQTDSLTRLRDNFQFEDGIYFSFDALKQNDADLGWYGIEGEMVELSGSMRVQIDGLGYGEAWVEKEPFAIVLDGKPYVLTKVDSLRGYHEFVGMSRLGAIAYYEYEGLVKRGQMMYAYNPLTQRPFREAYVERERVEWIRRCVDWNTGQQFELSRADLLIPLADQPDLIRAMSTLKSEDRDFYPKLLQAVVRYNERTPVYVPAKTLNR